MNIHVAIFSIISILFLISIIDIIKSRRKYNRSVIMRGKVTNLKKDIQGDTVENVLIIGHGEYKQNNSHLSYIGKEYSYIITDNKEIELFEGKFIYVYGFSICVAWINAAIFIIFINCK